MGVAVSPPRMAAIGLPGAIVHSNFRGLPSALVEALHADTLPHTLKPRP